MVNFWWFLVVVLISRFLVIEFFDNNFFLSELCCYLSFSQIHRQPADEFVARLIAYLKEIGKEWTFVPLCSVRQVNWIWIQLSNYRQFLRNLAYYNWIEVEFNLKISCNKVWKYLAYIPKSQHGIVNTKYVFYGML